MIGKLTSFGINMESLNQKGLNLKFNEDIFNVNLTELLIDYINQRDLRFKRTFDNEKISIGMLPLAPHKLSGDNICPKAGNCVDICIGDSDGKLQANARIKRTLLFQHDEDSFFEHLVKEIIEHVNKYRDNNPVIRLNGFSDILWEDKEFDYSENIKKAMQKYQGVTYNNTKLVNYITSHKKDKKILSQSSKYNIFDLFPDLLFYDYTKYRKREKLENYHLTFSYDKGLKRLPTENINITVIVNDDLKKYLLSLNNPIYIDGDKQDCRILDYDLQEQKIILLSFQNSDEDIDEVEYAITDYKEFQELILNNLK